MQLLPVDHIARRILENLARDPDFRRVGDSGVGGASHVFSNFGRQDRLATMAAVRSNVILQNSAGQSSRSVSTRPWSGPRSGR